MSKLHTRRQREVMARRPTLVPTGRGTMTVPMSVVRDNRSLQRDIDKGFRCCACGRLFTPSRKKSATHPDACEQCARDFN